MRVYIMSQRKGVSHFFFFASSKQLTEMNREAWVYNLDSVNFVMFIQEKEKGQLQPVPSYSSKYMTS